MLAEIPKVGIALQETLGRSREDDLASVRRRRDSRRPMEVDSDIAFVGELRLTGVDTDPNADRAATQRLARSACRRHRVGCAREGDEEGIALRVDLDAAVTGERRSQSCAMLGQELGVPRS